jgi:hypothetical protein
MSPVVWMVKSSPSVVEMLTVKLVVSGPSASRVSGVCGVAESHASVDLGLPVLGAVGEHGIGGVDFEDRDPVLFVEAQGEGAGRLVWVDRDEFDDDVETVDAALRSRQFADGDVGVQLFGDEFESGGSGGVVVEAGDGTVG